ncbi:mycothiol transferase [Kineosporia succinea]|uniref:Damage-inducible protein DinB n=1 Tax=Kineosporia succinea TaxID=84632 RepID=A0ABT9PBB0_9ACTN|nr:DUF664 domain-containing protein [Kineosporia succinea]MDP9829679.1 putative damage-inducible protein DinB [Kineosporia succinea]
MSVDAVRDLLLAQLAEVRQDAVGQFEGLSEAQAHEHVGPGHKNMLGLLHHLTVACERFWVRAVFAADQQAVRDFRIDPAAPEGGVPWLVAPEVPTSQVIDRYLGEVALVDDLLTRCDLDEPVRWWPLWRSDQRPVSLAEVVLAVILETASHNGQLAGARHLLVGSGVTHH